jgi:hypothetical protein
MPNTSSYDIDLDDEEAVATIVDVLTKRGCRMSHRSRYGSRRVLNSDEKKDGDKN